MDGIKNEQTTNFLKRLGFSDEEALLYVILAERGPLTFFQVSEASGIERTKLYRLSSDLAAKGLVEEQMAFKSKKLKAVELAKVRRLVEAERQRVNSLEAGWGEFAQSIQKAWSVYSPTEVLYFRGEQGIIQMMWNTLQAKGELLSYVYRAVQEIMGQKELDKWAVEAKASNIRIRELHSEIFPQSLKEAGHSSVNLSEMGQRYKARLLPTNVMKMTHAMDIYNDVVGIHYWKDGEAFGVEIHNETINTMQRSVFEVFWKLAKPYDYAKN